MKKQVKTILIVVLIVAVLGGAYGLYAALSRQAEIGGGGSGSSSSAEKKEYKDAPDFTVYDDSGKEVKLSGFRGKPVVVNFWASWCGPCETEMPHFQSAYETYGDKVQFMMVNLCGYGNDSKESAKALVESKGFTFPVFYDDNAEAMSAYVGRNIPVSAFINREGKLEALLVGIVSEKQMETYVTQILGEE